MAITQIANSKLKIVTLP